MVFLPVENDIHNILRDLIELVEVIGFGGGFLGRDDQLEANMRDSKDESYHDRRLVRFGGLDIPIGPDQSLPDGVKRRRRIVVWDGEKGTIPSSHAVGLLISVYQIIKDIVRVTPILISIRSEPAVNFSTSLNGRPDMNL